MWFLGRFGPKTGIDFDHYGLKSGMVFIGTTRVYKRICLFDQLQINKREKEIVKINSLELNFNKSVVGVLT